MVKIGRIYKKCAVKSPFFARFDYPTILTTVAVEILIRMNLLHRHLALLHCHHIHIIQILIGQVDLLFRILIVLLGCRWHSRLLGGLTVGAAVWIHNRSKHPSQRVCNPRRRLGNLGTKLIGISIEIPELIISIGAIVGWLNRAKLTVEF